MKDTQCSEDKLNNVNNLSSSYGSWLRSRVFKKESLQLADTIRTAFAVQALALCGESVTEGVVADGVKWLLGNQYESEKTLQGWNYSYKIGVTDRLLPTCIVLRAMICVWERFRINAVDNMKILPSIEFSIKSSIQYICSQYRNFGQDNHGAFGEDMTNILASTLQVLILLRVAARAGFPVDKEILDSAYKWLSTRSKYEVVVWLNETVDFSYIDERNKTNNRWKVGHPCNYVYTHVTPALYLAAFGSGIKSGDAKAIKALEAIQ